jgi:hypothetical protein
VRQLVRHPASRLLPALLSLAVLLAAGAPAWAQDDEPRVVMRKIERSCEGEGCKDDDHVVIELDGAPLLDKLGGAVAAGDDRPSTRAIIASPIGTKRGSRHGSWRPFTEISVGSPVRVTVAAAAGCCWSA